MCSGGIEWDFDGNGTGGGWRGCARDVFLEGLQFRGRSRWTADNQTAAVINSLWGFIMSLSERLSGAERRRQKNGTPTEHASPSYWRKKVELNALTVGNCSSYWLHLRRRSGEASGCRGAWYSASLTHKSDFHGRDTSRDVLMRKHFRFAFTIYFYIERFFNIQVFPLVILVSVKFVTSQRGVFQNWVF